MQKARIVTFSAPARYAEILEHVENKSALIVEALSYFFVRQNYDGAIKIANSPQDTKESRGNLPKVKSKKVINKIEGLRKDLSPQIKSLKKEEIIQLIHEGRPQTS